MPFDRGCSIQKIKYPDKKSPWEEQNLFIWETTENWQINVHPPYEFVKFENKIWSQNGNAFTDYEKYNIFG